MYRRDLLKGLAAGLIIPSQALAKESLPSWLNWEGKTSRVHFMHVGLEPADVKMKPGANPREIPLEWCLVDPNRIAQKFAAALRRAKTPDLSAPMFVMPASPEIFKGLVTFEEEPHVIVRSIRLNTETVYAWLNETRWGNCTQEQAAGALLLDAIWERWRYWADRGRLVDIEKLDLLSVQVPLA